MSRDEILDEFDRVLDTKMSAEYGDDAKLLASKLVGKLIALGDELDEESDDKSQTEFFMTFTQDSTKFSVLAKCYQTLIDEGKI
jgi:hypothetical protein